MPLYVPGFAPNFSKVAPGPNKAAGLANQIANTASNFARSRIMEDGGGGAEQPGPASPEIVSMCLKELRPLRLV